MTRKSDFQGFDDGYFPVPVWALALPDAGPCPSRRGKEGKTRVSAWGVLLLGVLARFQGQNETAWPSIEHLMKASGLKRRAVLEQLEALEDAGALVVERTAGRGSHYRIVPVRSGAPVRDDAPVATIEEAAAGPSIVAGPVHDGARVHGGAPVRDDAPDQCAAAHPTSAPPCTPPVRRGAPEEIREEIREDPGGDPGRARAGATADTTTDPELYESEFGQRCDWLWREWVKRYEHTRGGHPADMHGRAKREVVKVVGFQAVRDDAPFEELATRVLDAYWREEWPRDRANRPTLDNLARQVDRLIEAIRRGRGLRVACPAVATTTPEPGPVVVAPSDAVHDIVSSVTARLRGGTEMAAVAVQPEPVVVQREPTIVHDAEEAPPELHDVADALGPVAQQPVVVAGQRTTPLRVAAGLDRPTLRKAIDRITREGLRGMDAAAVVMGAHA